jgi:hypothetical protein
LSFQALLNVSNPSRMRRMGRVCGGSQAACCILMQAGGNRWGGWLEDF